MLNKIYKTLDNDASVLLLTGEDLSSVEIVDDDNLTLTGLTIVDDTKISFTVAEGDDNTEYTCILKATKTDGDFLRVIQSVVVDEDLIEYYGSIYDGNRYFEDRLRAESWTNASNSNRRKALIEATSLIDMLDFAGEPTGVQSLQFPRNGSTTIPDAINFAAYEVAIILLEGTDPQQVANSFGLTKEEFESVRVTYGPSVPLHLKSGLMSAKALMYLYPYLREKAAINLKRVN